ncbi:MULTISPECIES: HlyU family transcriptional regulator [unclassified Halomonas]|uniref:HlyU family transcriptional regulator n=1 Tax=unclassified Halomonas TaxID=2609666 RepID=UPI0021E50766|nr:MULTISPECIES: HlyU family transcriptional regulator [unclassified Halomonas]UYG01573.1 HlyU family transcriptional regulator [Halomonas sp. GD1P12]WNL37371.1 HlyU family transcriptional regulator [Halomonas sp. PAMB 3232]WNL40687.1 HlyU family transcriptional regulator [Halomonas sp. PAMB 3264]
MFKKLLSALMGGSEKPAATSRASEPVIYCDFAIVSTPDAQSGQYRVSGTISKTFEDGQAREHRFERSDMLPSRQACDEMMVTKAKRYIDEVGEAMFEPDPRDKS